MKSLTETFKRIGVRRRRYIHVCSLKDESLDLLTFCTENKMLHMKYLIDSLYSSAFCSLAFVIFKITLSIKIIVLMMLILSLKQNDNVFSSCSVIV